MSAYDRVSHPVKQKQNDIPRTIGKPAVKQRKCFM